jgi:pimeloyl-ACP methyl ester carboxylesterase
VTGAASKIAHGFAILLAALAAGCVTPERVANRIITPPNLQRDYTKYKKEADHWLVALAGGKNPLHYFAVPVGPPDARLEVAQLLPGECPLKLCWQVTPLPNGKTNLVVSLQPKTNAPAAPPRHRGTIFVLHGYTAMKEMMLPWAVTLANDGYVIFLVDLRGHGQSTGRTFSCGKYETTDMVQALDYLTARHVCEDRVGVLGDSFGADIALQWAARDSRVRAVTAIAPFNQPQDALTRFARDIKFRISPVVLSNAMALVSARLEMNWSDYSGERAVKQMKQPVLLIGGGKDTISPPADLAVLSSNAPPGSKTIMVPVADHYMLPYFFQELDQPVKAWFREHLAVDRQSLHGDPEGERPAASHDLVQ